MPKVEICANQLHISSYMKIYVQFSCTYIGVIHNHKKMKTKEWFEEYITLFKDGEVEKVMQNKKAILPTSLFKYTQLHCNSLDCLEHSSVWMAAADTQNDPFECFLKYEDSELTRKFFRDPQFQEKFRLIYNSDISLKEIEDIQNDINPEKKFQNICKEKGIKKFYGDGTNQRNSIISSLIKKYMSKIHLSSFSERNDSILMWTHYSQKHKGICIEYDFSNDYEIIEYLEPVYYTKQRYAITNAYGFDKINNTLRIAAFTKAKDWKYEKEWRIVFPCSKEGYLKVPKPKAIYLGTRFDENKDELKERINRLSENLSIPLYKMKLHDTKYKIIKDKE